MAVTPEKLGQQSSPVLDDFRALERMKALDGWSPGDAFSAGSSSLADDVAANTAAIAAAQVVYLKITTDVDATEGKTQIQAIDSEGADLAVEIPVQINLWATALSVLSDSTGEVSLGIFSEGAEDALNDPTVAAAIVTTNAAGLIEFQMENKSGGAISRVIQAINLGGGPSPALKAQAFT